MANAAEKPIPEEARGPERAEASKEAPKEGEAKLTPDFENLAERVPGQKIELLRPDGSKFELVSLGGDAVAHPSDTGPKGRLMPDLEISARESAQREFSRLEGVFDSALTSTAVALDLESAEKDEWIEAMSTRKNELIMRILRENNPDAAIVEHLKQEQAAQDRKAETILQLEAQLQQARSEADRAYADVEANENKTSIEAYDETIALVRALEHQIVNEKTRVNPDLNTDEVLDALEGFADLKMETLHEQGGDAVRARIKEIENQMRELDKTLNKNPDDIEALTSWKIFDQERQRHGALLPIIDRKDRIKEIEDRMREIDKGSDSKSAQAEYQKIDAERKKLAGEIDVIEIPELPDDAMEDFDPKTEDIYKMFAENFKYGSKAEIAKLLVVAIKLKDQQVKAFGEDNPEALAMRAFLRDARDGKLERSPTLEVSEEGKITVEAGVPVEQPKAEATTTAEAGEDFVDQDMKTVASELNLTPSQLADLKTNFEAVKAFAKEVKDSSLSNLIDFDWTDFMNAPDTALPPSGAWNTVKSWFNPSQSPREDMWEKMAEAYARVASGNVKVSKKTQKMLDRLRTNLNKTDSIWHVKT